MATVIWSQEALDRLRDVHDYIAQHNSTAATSVVNGIFDKVELLRTHPRLGQRSEIVADREVREITYGHYRIPYLIVDEGTIKILGVFHGAMEIDRYLQ